MRRWLETFFGIDMYFQQGLWIFVCFALMLTACQKNLSVSKTISAHPSDTSVVGGQEVMPEQFEKQEMAHSVVGIYVVSGKQGSELLGTYCTGTLIAHRWVLTAAHCLTTVLDQDPKNIFVGIHTTEITIQQLQAENYWIHRDDRASGQNADLALIEIPELDLEDFQPISLISNSTKVNLQQSVFVIGYGRNEDRNLRDEGGKGVLRWAEKLLVNADIKSEHFELDLSDGIGTCQGDSGGPLLMKNANGEFVQLGVLKGNVQKFSAEKTKRFYELGKNWERFLSEYPEERLCGGKSRHLNLLPHLDWIQKVMREN